MYSHVKVDGFANRPPTPSPPSRNPPQFYRSLAAVWRRRAEAERESERERRSSRGSHERPRTLRGTHRIFRVTNLRSSLARYSFEQTGTPKTENDDTTTLQTLTP